jgi:pimeloyl-ACP methyl ester carboxylesterase
MAHHAPTIPPIWREARVAVEAPGLLLSREFRSPQPSATPGMPVLLITGVYGGDATLTPMAQWLSRMGYAPKRAGILVNADCSEAETARLTVRLERAVQRSGRRAAIVGWSRGGLFARTLAVRRPDLVAGIVTLGSPLVTTMRHVHPLLHLALDATSTLGDRGIPRLLTHKCADESMLDGAEEMSAISRPLLARARRLLSSGDGVRCCEAYWRDLRGPFPDDVTFAAIYSRSDGVVNWEGCLDPAARHVEVDSSHLGLGLNARVYRAIATELATIGACEHGAADIMAGRRARRRDARAA